MKSCLEEYKDIDVNEIVEKYIEGTPEIGSTGVDRDQTNRQINGLSNDDASVNENNIRYDIRFYALAPKDGGLIKAHHKRRGTEQIPPDVPAHNPKHILYEPYDLVAVRGRI